MNKEEAIKFEDLEFKEALAKLQLDIRSTKMMLVVFGILAVIVRTLFGVPLSFLILVILSGWFLLYLLYGYLVKKTKTSRELYNLYFGYNLLDLFLLTIIIHYLGGAEWLGMLFYILTLLLAGIILPKKRTIVLGFVAGFFYSLLLLLEYVGIVSHKSLFLLNPDLYRFPPFVVSQILVVAALFYFIVETTGSFATMLKEKRKQLVKERERAAGAYKEAEEAKKVLEIKVEARTSELKELAKSLEEKVKQRTEELQEAKEVLEIRVEARTKELKELAKSLEEKVRQRTEELQEKIEELERFRKLAVGRELKMLELKDKIKQLEKELKKKS